MEKTFALWLPRIGKSREKKKTRSAGDCSLSHAAQFVTVLLVRMKIKFCSRNEKLSNRGDCKLVSVKYHR